jgi:acyl-CoA thioester hydrolase
MPQYIPTYSGVVTADHLDALGHMNVQHYMGRISDAAFVVLERLGLGVETIATRRVNLAAVRAEIDFLSELGAGDAIAMESTIAAVGTKSLTIHHRLKATDTGQLAMQARVVAVCIDLDRRVSMPLPDDVAAKARELMNGADIAPT